MLGPMKFRSNSLNYKHDINVITTLVLVTHRRTEYVSDLKKPFTSIPYSVSVETDRNVELRCLPPDGVPPPRVYWLRNNVLIEPDNNMIVSSEGNLLIGQARLQDTANYTCVAENVAAKRLSDPALLTVYGKFRFRFVSLSVSRIIQTNVFDRVIWRINLDRKNNQSFYLKI